MKKLALLFLFFLTLVVPPELAAKDQENSIRGMIINASGIARIKSGQEEEPAAAGAWVREGDVISLGNGGNVTLLFLNGLVAKIDFGKAKVGYYEASKSEKSPVKYLSLALQDLFFISSHAKGVYHMATKDIFYQKGKPHWNSEPQNLQLSKDQKSSMETDLKNALSYFGAKPVWKIWKRNSLTDDGKAIISALIYYRYKQYNKMFEILEPLYLKAEVPSNGIRQLLALAFGKVGSTDESKIFWDF